MRAQAPLTGGLLLCAAFSAVRCGVPGATSDDAASVDVAGTACEDTPVRCGSICWYDRDDYYDGPFCGVAGCDTDPLLDAVMAGGWAFRTVAPDGPAPPSLPGWRFRRDGSEALLVMQWDDSFADAEGINHCFPSGGIAYVLEFPSGALLYARRLEDDAWHWTRYTEPMCDTAWDSWCFDGSTCPDRVSGAEVDDCPTAVSVAHDQGMYFSWRSPTDPAWWFEGDVLDGAVHRFKLSTGEYLSSVDLPLE